MKKLIALAISALLVAGAGAYAGDKHHCKKGSHWDEKTAACVKSETK